MIVLGYDITLFQLNLFVCDALPVLLALKAPNVSLEKGLKPITEFLTSYITQLRNWLYIDCFRRVLECLWIFIVQVLHPSFNPFLHE